MIKLTRSKDLEHKQVFRDSLIGKEVIRDARLYCSNDGHVYFKRRFNDDSYYYTDGRVQFPKKLRENRIEYIADIYRQTTKNGSHYWTTYKGTIRNMKGEIVG